MTTLFSAGGTPILPESVVVGTGSYTVPAGKFGLLTARASTDLANGFDNDRPDGGTYSGSCSDSMFGQQWLVAGVSITVANSANIATTQSGNDTFSAYRQTAQVSIGGTAFVFAASRLISSATGANFPTRRTEGSSSSSWSISLFSVP